MKCYKLLHILPDFLGTILFVIVLIKVVVDIELKSVGLVGKEDEARIIGVQHLPELEAVCFATASGDVNLYNTGIRQVSVNHLIARMIGSLMADSIEYILRLNLYSLCFNVCSYTPLGAPGACHHNNNNNNNININYINM